MGFRSALATKALVDMGFKNVANARGGFDALKNAGLKVIDKEKNNYLLASFKTNSILSWPQNNLLFETKVGAPKIPFS